MRLVDNSKLIELQKQPKNIRNICIVAHVDHGKTTLADSLVACNGIISQKMVGKLRYMDSRPDEQERGITMKSSCIALYWVPSPDGEEYLINLIDSPGHVDFLSEVATGIRLCDGAVVVIDIIEGVCPQTRVALRQAWQENIKPILVFNKLDRLIIETKLAPLDAYVRLSQILEQANAVMGELFAIDVLNRDEEGEDLMTLHDADDSNLYFSPETGNVVFASAIDGWGFTIQQFAKLYAERLGVSEVELTKALWGDYYLSSRTKQILQGAQEKARKPLFVQLALENIWSVYETLVVRKERDKVGQLAERVGVTLPTRDLRLTDGRAQLKAVLGRWLPLADAVLCSICSCLPSPKDLTETRAERLLCIPGTRYEALPAEAQRLRTNLLDCKPDAPLIAYVSKMFSVDRSILPENRPKPLSREELERRRDEARARLAKMNLEKEETPNVVQVENNKAENSDQTDSNSDTDTENDTLIAFTRVFSGTLEAGAEVWVCGARGPVRATVGQLYVLMGRELEPVDAVPAGNIVGVGGLGRSAVRGAALSTSPDCPAWWGGSAVNDSGGGGSNSEPVVRVALEPAKTQDLARLRRGLRRLCRADAAARVLEQATGELVLLTAGQLHLERCLRDLRTRYAPHVEIVASEPIVPFRETVIPPPTRDMVNEAVSGENSVDTVTVTTANRQMRFTIRATPLPDSVTTILEENYDLLRVISGISDSESDNQTVATELTDRTIKAIDGLKSKLTEAFQTAGAEWSDAMDSMWSVGPRRCGPNVLLNRIPDYVRNGLWTKQSQTIDDNDPRREFDSCVVGGFQLVTLAGPLCEEPMRGVCFVLEEWMVTLDKTANTNLTLGPLAGQVVSAVKDGCRRAFQAQPQRLVAAMYTCTVSADQEVLGRMYAVLGRRHGRVLGGDMTQGSAIFTVTAVLPVVESFDFVAELRKQTSGLASPQLLFSHWEVIDVDPWWIPSTEEEYLHFGEKADSDNRARRYVEAVRARKGLRVQRPLVERAEKQRTLSKKK